MKDKIQQNSTVSSVCCYYFPSDVSVVRNFSSIFQEISLKELNEKIAPLQATIMSMGSAQP